VRTSNARAFLAAAALLIPLVATSCGQPSAGPTPLGLNVTGIAPNTGPIGAGTVVSITGSGFVAGVTVTFDGIAATVTGFNATTITVMPPAHAPGRVDVVVTNPSGSSARLANAYTYAALSITSIAPTKGFAGTPLRIVGTGFTATTNVTLDGLQAQFVSVSGPVITVLIPVRGFSGPVDLVVMNPDGESRTLTSGFTYEFATLSVDPISVPPAGQFNVTWTASSGRSFLDWIGLFKTGTSNLEYIWYEYTNGTTSGTVRFTAPVQPGQYQFRYLLDDGYVDVVRTASVTVGALSASGQSAQSRIEHESLSCLLPSKDTSRSVSCSPIGLPLLLSPY